MRGKLTVANCSPTVAVNLPLWPVESMPGASVGAEVGALCFNPLKGSVYAYIPNSTGKVVWQELKQKF